MQRQGTNGDSAGIRVRATGGVLLVAHLALVAWITLRPLDVTWVSATNLRPFAGIRADLALGWPEAARRTGEGLALLAPLGVLLPMAHGRLTVSPFGSLARAVTSGALLSLAIELLQTGVPGQVVDIDSILLNTVGVGLAHLLVVPAARAALRRRGGGRGRRSRTGDRELAALRMEERGEPSQGRTPTIARVEMAP